MQSYAVTRLVTLTGGITVSTGPVSFFEEFRRRVVYDGEPTIGSQRPVGLAPRPPRNDAPRFSHWPDDTNKDVLYLCLGEVP